ncbi:MAG: hypothetical protein J6K43_05200 [Lachnospiraceae bacterium]|nr:hypothetical protein [Lachnospiraceae bacterium]
MLGERGHSDKRYDLTLEFIVGKVFVKAAQKYDVAVTLLCDTNNRFLESFEKLIRKAMNSDSRKSLTKMDGQIIL